MVPPQRHTSHENEVSSTVKGTDTSSPAVTLPDKIIVKIIGESIEPYSLEIVQTQYDKREPKFAHIGDGHEYERYAGVGRAVLTSYHGMKAAHHWYVAHEGSLERLSEFPEALNLKLVNTMFFNETEAATRDKFNGNIHFRNYEIGLGPYIQEWIPIEDIRGDVDFFWLRPKITHVTMSMNTIPSAYTSIFSIYQTPNLQSVTLQAGVEETLSSTDIGALAGNEDQPVLQLFERIWAREISRFRHFVPRSLLPRGIDVEVMLKLSSTIPPPPLNALNYRTMADKTLNFVMCTHFLKVDLLHDGSTVLRGRKMVNLPYRKFSGCEVWDEVGEIEGKSGYD